MQICLGQEQVARFLNHRVTETRKKEPLELRDSVSQWREGVCKMYLTKTLFVQISQSTKVRSRWTRLLRKISCNLLHQVTEIMEGFVTVARQALQVDHFKLDRKRAFIFNGMQFLNIAT